jgi:hypothetical protein
VGGASAKVFALAFRFTFKQLKVRLDANTLRVRTGRFQELLDAVAAARMRYRSAALAAFAPRGVACLGSWPWDAADLGDWLRPAGGDSDCAALRPINLGSRCADEMTFTHRC